MPAFVAKSSRISVSSRISRTPKKSPAEIRREREARARKAEKEYFLMGMVIATRMAASDGSIGEDELKILKAYASAAKITKEEMDWCRSVPSLESCFSVLKRADEHHVDMAITLIEVVAAADGVLDPEEEKLLKVVYGKLDRKYYGMDVKATRAKVLGLLKDIRALVEFKEDEDEI